MGFTLLLFLALLVLSHQTVPSTFVAPPAILHIIKDPQIKAADTTVPHQVDTPTQIGSLAEAIFEGDSGCKIVYNEPAFQKGSYMEIPVDKQQIAGSSWMTEIMSFTYNQNAQILYALLDNGSLIESKGFSLSAQTQNKVETKKYDRDSLQSTDTWFTSHHQLIYFGNELFSLAKQELKQLRIHQEGFWTIDDNSLLTNVVSIKIYETTMYVLTNTELIAYTSQGRQPIRKGGKFQDFVILSNVLYLLDKESGLIQIYKGRQGRQQKVTWETEMVENAVKLAGINNTLMIIYELEHRNYIAEYFIDRSQKLYRNRYYHNYYKVKDLYCFGQYAIVDAYNQYFILHHSVNREAFEKLTPLEFLYSSNATKVSGVQLTSKAFSFLIGSKNKVEHITVSTTSSGLSSQRVECLSSQDGKIVINITFRGPCLQNYSAEKLICSVKIPLSLNLQYDYERRHSENSDSKLILRLIWVILVVFSCALCFAQRRRLKRLHQKLKKEAEQLRQKREQHSVNMEQTFIPG